jgi:hypothetical protein
MWWMRLLVGCVVELSYLSCNLCTHNTHDMHTPSKHTSNTHPCQPSPPQAQKLRDEFNIDIRVLGIAGATNMVLSESGVDLANWRDELKSRAQPTDLKAFGDALAGSYIPNRWVGMRVFVKKWLVGSQALFIEGYLSIATTCSNLLTIQPTPAPPPPLPQRRHRLHRVRRPPLALLHLDEAGPQHHHAQQEAGQRAAGPVPGGAEDAARELHPLLLRGGWFFKSWTAV